MTRHIDILVREAMQELSNLSNEAEKSGDDSLRYAANRAWRELFKQQNSMVVTKLKAASRT